MSEKHYVIRRGSGDPGSVTGYLRQVHPWYCETVSSIAQATRFTAADATSLLANLDVHDECVVVEVES